MDAEEFIRNAPFYLSNQDKEALRQLPEDFRPDTWDQVKKILGSLLHI
jgi:hypothetical protein